MKGQHLFIRPIDDSDAALLATFLSSHSPDSPIPACGLLAKLLGDLVAVIAFDLDGDDSVRITDLVVVPALRRRRIGRAVIEETVQLARKLDRKAVLAPRSDASDFFLRTGFIESGSMLIRRV